MPMPALLGEFGAHGLGRCDEVLQLGQVSALPRVFRPQSGLIHTFSTSIFFRIS